MISDEQFVRTHSADADDIDGDYVDIFPGTQGANDPKPLITAGSWKNWLQPSQSLSEPSLRISWHNCSSSEKLSTAYNCVSSTDPIFLA